jgi:hypothetical protein
MARERIRTLEFALARRDPETHTVSLILDATTALIPPSSPLTLTPTNEKLTSARSRSSVRACPRVPMAEEIAKPLPLVRRA